MGYRVPVSLFPFVTSISADPDKTNPLVQVLSDWARTLKCFMLCSILVQPRNTDMNEKLLTGVLSINSNKETEEFLVCSGHFLDNREFTSHLLKRKKNAKIYI